MIRNYEQSSEHRIVDKIGTALLIIVIVAALTTATALASTMWAIGQKTERTMCLREAARSSDFKTDCGRPGIVERMIDATLQTVRP